MQDFELKSVIFLDGVSKIWRTFCPRDLYDRSIPRKTIPLTAMGYCNRIPSALREFHDLRARDASKRSWAYNLRASPFQV